MPTAKMLKPLLTAALMFGIALAPTALVRYQATHPSAVNLGIADPAASACSRMERVADLIAADVNYRVVLAEVGAAMAEAERATAADPAWRPLLGAVGAIDNGLHGDDQAASALGASVLRYTCRGLTTAAN